MGRRLVVSFRVEEEVLRALDRAVVEFGVGRSQLLGLLLRCWLSLPREERARLLYCGVVRDGEAQA